MREVFRSEFLGGFVGAWILRVHKLTINQPGMGNLNTLDGFPEGQISEALQHQAARQYAGLLLLSGRSKVHKTQHMFKELVVLQKVTSLS